MGDLTVTCFSKQSRNRTLGERIAKGEPLEEVLASATAEGHPTAKSARALAQTLDVETPIIEQVHAMLYEGKGPKEALKELMMRERRGED
jgi:glycerol-3-phosphate dehydrogenase (NAD(P)+)